MSWSGQESSARSNSLVKMVQSDIGGRDLILVTGVSGFVGCAIANAARTAGYRVRVLVRQTSPRTNINPADEMVVGDIRDRSSIVPALRDVRYVVHAAADYWMWSPLPDDIVRS